MVIELKNPNMTRADLASLNRLNERRQAAQKIEDDRRKEAKIRRINKADLMRKTHTQLQDFISNVFKKHNIPLDKWGHFFVTGAYTSSDIPGGNPQFNDNDYRIALLLDLSEKIRSVLDKPEGLDKPVRQVAGIPDSKITSEKKAEERVKEIVKGVKNGNRIESGSNTKQGDEQSRKQDVLDKTGELGKLNV